MTELEALRLFESSGAIIRGHFVYSSWRHGTIYIDAEALFRDSKLVWKLCRPIAERFRNSAVNSVTGPARGGIVVASRVAEHLSDICRRKVVLIPTIKTLADNFFIRSAFRHQIFNQKVLVVDDVITTAGSAEKVVGIVRALGGNVVGLGALCNRGGDLSRGATNVPDFFALVDIFLQSWSEDQCPSCKRGIPVNPNFGRGGEFFDRERPILFP